MEISLTEVRQIGNLKIMDAERESKIGGEGFSMKVVARRTGLSPHVIRVWERRYKAVGPSRSGTGRRLYSEADIERLNLLRAATQAGYSIGQIAQFSDEKLRSLNTRDDASTHIDAGAPFALRGAENSSAPRVEIPADEYLAQCMAAVRDLDTAHLERVLLRASVALGRNALLEKILVPLMKQIGQGWRSGELRIAHEHMASAAVRTFLGTLSQNSVGENAPLLVVTTPAGQVHEIGALIVGAFASSQGWRVSYLGPNLPAEEIAAVALKSGARAIALSFVYPPDDAQIAGELQKLHDALEGKIQILAGGRAAASYAETLKEIGAIQFSDIAALRRWLDESRMRSE
jgi:MerR family transcriptional regulator, light-induced transcriptional regulator